MKKKKKLLFFFQSTHQVGMKNVVKCYKDFFGYFNALKTHSAPLSIRSPDLSYFHLSGFAVPEEPEEPSASNKITPEMAEKLNKLFQTGTNYLERFVNFLGSIFKDPEEISAEEEEPRPKKVFQLIFIHKLSKEDLL